jgi:hypothetical protein
VQEDPLWHKASVKELSDLTDQYRELMKLNPSTKLRAKEKVTNLLLVGCCSSFLGTTNIIPGTSLH